MLTVDPDLVPYVSSRDAIGDLEDLDHLASPDEAVNGKYGHLLAEIPPGGNYLHYTEKLGHPEPLFRWRGRYWTFLLKLDPDRAGEHHPEQSGSLCRAVPLERSTAARDRGQAASDVPG